MGAVYEEEVKPLLFQVFCETEADAQALVEEYVEMYKALEDGEDSAKQIAVLRQQIDLAQKKKSKLLSYNAASRLSNWDFLSMNKACDKEISKEFVDKYIDKIFAMSKEDNSLWLQIKIFTGDSTDKYLTNLRSCTGHTFKKWISVRTMSFKWADRTAVGHQVTSTYLAGLYL